MSALLLSMPLPLGFRIRLWKLAQDGRFRYLATALLADVLGYSLVFTLNHHGVNAIRSNLYVSVCMTPINLWLNTWSLTARRRPTLSQAGSWYAYWLPTSARNTYYMTWLIATFGVSGVQARGVVAVTFFLSDYVAKRWIIFGKCGELARHYFTRLCLWHYYGAVVGAETT